jgi:hypothetical protein
MSKPITFQIVKGTKIRRNAETGLEIHGDCDGFTFFARLADGSLSYWGSENTLREALEEGREKVEMLRENVAIDHADALLMDAKRA